MPKFAYEALDARGKMVAGVLHAENVEAAIDNLRLNKFTVTTVKQTSDVFGVLTRARAAVEQAIPIRPYAIVVFTRQLATIFNSGIPLLKGLDCLSRQALDARLTAVVTSVFTEIRNGLSLSQAMSLHPRAFTPVYLAMVRAGETAGELGSILNRMADLAERDYALRKRVQAAMTYPIFVFATALVATWLVVTYVFPTFVSLLEGLNLDLPLPTRLLIALTNVSGNPIFCSSVVALSIIGLLVLRAYMKTSEGKYQCDLTLLTLPVVGLINKKVALSQFCRTLGTLVASGVSMMQSIETVSFVAGNEVIRRASGDIMTALKAGLKLSQPMRDNRVFPPMMFHMVAVGEETGTLPVILEKLAYFYDLEVEAMLAIFATLMEPLMIALMGLVVLFVILAVFLPVYSIMGSFR